MAQAALPSKQAAGSAARARPPASASHYLNNLYFRDGIVATTLLAAFLYLTLAMSFDSAGHVATGLGVVVPVTLGAVILGTLMSFSRFDSFFALSHALFAGLALTLFVMARLPTPDEIEPIVARGAGELQARTYFVLLRLLGWVDAAINHSASADNFVFIFEICFLLWWLAFLGMWSILRYGYIWRAVVPAALVLIINANYAPNSVSSLVGLFALLALFLLIRANLSEQQLRWRDRHVHVSHDLTWDFVRTGLTYSLIVLAAAWLLPGLGRNVQVRQLLAPINEQFEAAQQEVNRLYQGLNRRQDSASAAFGRSLALGGPRNLGDDFVFSVKAASGRYWRAVTFDTWTGRGWVNSSQTEARLDAFQPAPIGNWDERIPLTQTVRLMANTGNVVFGVPDIRQLSLPVDVLLNGVPAAPLEAPPLGEGLPPAVEFTMVRARETLDIGDEYNILSHAGAVSVAAMVNATGEPPAEVLDRYVQIPTDFSPRVAHLAQSLTLTETTTYGKVKAIERYLRTIPYSDQIAAPPPDRDPIEYFLFEIRTGYCDYYASAMAMMVRSLGIPARTASGYAEGVFDEESGAFFIRERDAHTWVEVFFPGLGWVEFEPTAGESPLERPVTDEDLAAMTNTGAQQAPRPTEQTAPNAPQPAAGETSELDTPDIADMRNLPWWLWALLAPLLIGLGLWATARSRIIGPTAFTAELPVLLFERLQRWAGRLGLAPQAHQTPWEQARTWSRALPDGAAPIRRITGSYVLHRFARPAAGASDGAPPVTGAATTPAAGAAATPAAAERAADAAAWQELRPIFVRAWFHRLLPRRRTNSSHYTLAE